MRVVAISTHILGEKFTVDAPSAGARSRPSIATLGGSSFVVGYSSNSIADVDIGAVSGQIFTSTGQKSGSDFFLHTDQLFLQDNAQVDRLPNGGFLATWFTSDLSGASNQVSIRGQIFDANGVKVGSELLFKSGLRNDIWSTSVTTTVLQNGQFVVTWHDNNGSFDGYGRLFGTNGLLIGTEFALNGATSVHTTPEVLSLAAGGFSVRWADISNPAAPVSAFRTFDASGNPLGSEAQLPGFSASGKASAFSDGGFVSVWVTAANGRQDVKARLFDASGNPSGTEFLVNIGDNTYNDYPDVAVLSDGTFVVTWQRPSYYYNAQGFVVNQGYGITAQLFSGNGTKIGNQFWIDSTNGNRYSGPDIEALDNGGYVVSWLDQKYDFADPDSSGLKARIFGPNSIPVIVSGNGDVASYSIPENSVAVATVAATDADINARLTYSITGGQDAAFFTINALTGVLAFRNAPDFEGVAFHPNTYVVAVSVSDGYDSDIQLITVNVTNVLEGNTIFGTSSNDVISAVRSPVGQPRATDFEDTIFGGDGNDLIDGAGGGDLLYGGNGNDTYTIDNLGDQIFEDANAGIDTVKSALVSIMLGANLEKATLTGALDLNATGNDLDNNLTGNSGANVLIGGGGRDVLNGAAGHDILVGETGRDTLSGGDGDDTLIGGAGADSLTGGLGADTFLLDSLTVSADRDTIRDFVGGTDQLALSRAAFAGLAGSPAGDLSASAFALGTAATSASHRIIYNASNGALFYDADGVGGLAQVQIATLTGAPVLAASDIILI